MKSFKEIWNERNPVHETNADTGEDMFWKTAQIVAEEFCSQSPSTEVKGQKGVDNFVKKHLLNIMDKTLDGMIITHIEKMWGSLEMASVQYFIETGKVSGSFHLRLKEFAKQFATAWHNTASQPQEGQDELWRKLFEDLDKWARTMKGSGDTEIKIKELVNSFTLIKK